MPNMRKNTMTLSCSGTKAAPASARRLASTPAELGLLSSLALATVSLRVPRAAALMVPALTSEVRLWAEGVFTTDLIDSIALRR